MHPREFRLACREKRYSGTTRGVSLGFLQCNLAVIHQRHAYEFLLYCQRNQRSCPVLEVCDTGNPEPLRLAPGADLRTDLPRYAVYREGKRLDDQTDIRNLWSKDHVAFLIGSGISFDDALEQAGVQTTRDRWVLRTSLRTEPAGRFHGSLIVTMRWLTPPQVVKAVQVTTRFPFNHGAPIHIGDPEAIGADLGNPLVGIELNYDLDNDLSPKSGTKECLAIRKMADDIGIAISGLCSFLFWPYPLTSNDPAIRAKAEELAGKMTVAAHDLGVENLLVVPGAVHIPWRTDYQPVPNDVCDRRAREAIGRLLPQAEKLGVSLNIENIFFNGYLMTPGEMIAFVDHFQSEHVRVHFDTGNIMMFQFPEHWIAQLGKRIKNIHFKEFTKKGTDYSLESFRPLLDGTTNWPAVLEELNRVGYGGYLTFEYFHPYQHYPEALIFQTSDSFDRMLGKTAAVSK